MSVDTNGSKRCNCFRIYSTLQPWRYTLPPCIRPIILADLLGKARKCAIACGTCSLASIAAVNHTQLGSCS